MVKHLTNPFSDSPIPLGSLLSAAGQRVANELDLALHAAGFSDLRSSHAPIFMGVASEGTRLTDLARHARMTKQAAGELVRYLAERGYLEIASDPSDRRAKRVFLTDKGWTVITVGEKVIADFDRWLQQLIGVGQLNELRQILTVIAETSPSARQLPRSMK